MGKTLSVAFVWHMHQPLYKDHLTGKYFMPWVRLHAIKDYLDMVLILKEFPRIKQTFNLVPSLIDQLNDYAYNEAHDIHSALMIKHESEFSDKDKIFILERCFDASYNNLIAPNEYYHQLYQRSKQKSASANLNNFSNQEYADIIMWFNLVWFDPMWYEEIPELNKFYNQNKNFSLEQRIRLLEIQRDLIKRVIPTYKEFQDRGQIEVTTTPYYHPIMPLLIDTDSAKISNPNIKLPKERFSHPEDAKEHLLRAISKYEEIFGRPLRGLWPSEQSVSPETIKLIADTGIKWVISDEGVLAASLCKEFHRNFYGNLEDPRDLCQPYKLDMGIKPVNIIFRNVVYSDLIGFHFGKIDPSQAAWELYDRIKDIQQKLVNSTDNYLLTIALDGENCWEYYTRDGIPFLKQLYQRLSEDLTLNITTVSDYLDQSPPTKTLNSLHSGSWINRDFHIWIGDPAKNTGWNYLKNARDDLVRLTNTNTYDNETIKKAWEELYIAEGSDWFWWYGDPNISSQDDLFDEQFRLHLQNIYRVLKEPIPEYLFVPVEVYLGRSTRYPTSMVSPTIDGEVEEGEGWLLAGYMDMYAGAMYQSERILRRIWFGLDKNNLKIRLDTTQNIYKKEYEIYIYYYNPWKPRSNSHVRLRSRAGFTPETFKYKYAYETYLCPGDNHMVTTFSEAVAPDLWEVKENTKTKVAIGSVIELSIPFDELQVSEGNEIHFVVLLAKSQILLELTPENKAISVRRGTS